MVYFNAKSEEIIVKSEEDTKPPDDIFSQLPLNVIIQIFTFLDAVSLCQCAAVQRSWYQLSNRNDVWGEMLERDRNIWRCVGFRTHPKVTADPSNKAIYIKSRPEVALRKVSVGGITSFLKKAGNKLRNFIPKCILFGSGLESSQLVRNWLLSAADPNSPFRQAGYSQGEHGMGAGIHLELIGQGIINVVTLYNATWAERKAIVAGERPRINRLLEDPNKGTAKEDSGDEMSYEDSVRLLPQIRDLCTTIDAAIFAVESNAPRSQFRVDKAELKAMLSCAPPKSPLIVLSVRPNPTMPVGLTALEMSDILELSEMERPWLVHSVCGTEQVDLVPCVKWCLQELDMIGP